MSKRSKFLMTILSGDNDNNILFGRLCTLLRWFGFSEKITGDHHKFNMNGVEELLNLLPNGEKAKGYQVKQVRGVILKYKLGG